MSIHWHQPLQFLEPVLHQHVRRRGCLAEWLDQQQPAVGSNVVRLGSVCRRSQESSVMYDPLGPKACTRRRLQQCSREQPRAVLIKQLTAALPPDRFSAATDGYTRRSRRVRVADPYLPIAALVSDVGDQLAIRRIPRVVFVERRVQPPTRLALTGQGQYPQVPLRIRVQLGI